MVKRLYGQMQQREETAANCERGAAGTIELSRRDAFGWELLGWDLLELIKPGTVVYRRQLEPPHTARAPCWLPLTETVPVYFGQDVGELIAPVKPQKVCELWRQIPGGFDHNLLVASVRCIREISWHAGFQDCCLLSNSLVWEYNSSTVFRACRQCIPPEDAAKTQEQCRDALQVLKQRKSWDLSAGRQISGGNFLPRIVLDGAAVFGNRASFRDLIMQ